MYNKNKAQRTSIEVNESSEGEPIEQKIERIINNNEPITDGAPTIYTERADGIMPEYDIRTDRFDVALDGMDVVSRDRIAKREERQKKIVDDYNKSQGIGEPEPTRATNENPE